MTSTMVPTLIEPINHQPPVGEKIRARHFSQPGLNRRFLRQIVVIFRALSAERADWIFGANCAHMETRMEVAVAQSISSNRKTAQQGLRAAAEDLTGEIATLTTLEPA